MRPARFAIDSSSQYGIGLLVTTYAHGDGDIPDPVSCNSCSCVDGELVCTEIGCPEPCPPGTGLGEQCAVCGPADACEVVEHACLPSCDGDCAAGACVNGVCIAGLCG